MGSAGRTFGEQNFSVEAHAKTLASILNGAWT